LAACDSITSTQAWLSTHSTCAHTTAQTQHKHGQMNGCACYTPQHGWCA
jgi:hypothetical protein